MRVIRFFLKTAVLPVVVALTVLQWLFIFLIGFSSVVFDMLAGLFLLTAVMSYLMGISDGKEALGMVAAGFAVFMIQVIGAWIVMQINAINMNMRVFLSVELEKLNTVQCRRYYIPEPSLVAEGRLLTWENG